MAPKFALFTKGYKLSLNKGFKNMFEFLDMQKASFWLDVPQIMEIRRINTLGRFSAILDKGDNFCYFLFAFLYTKLYLKVGQLFKKRICSKGEQILSF